MSGETIFRSRPTLAQIRSAGSSVHLLEGPFQDLEWLGLLGDRLESLTITAQVQGSLQVVNDLRKLSLLRLWCGPVKGQVNLENLPRLSLLALHGSVKVDWTNGGLELGELVVESPPLAWQGVIQELPRLRRLQMSRSKFVPASFVGPISELSLAMMRWPSGVGPLGGVGELRSIDLTSVRGIVDLSPFSGARQLDAIYIEDCPDFVEISGASVAPNPNILLVGGTPARKAWLERR